MNDMVSDLLDFLRQNPRDALVLVIVSVFLGAILNKLIPYLWELSMKGFSRIGRLIGGRFAFRAFERHYLDWLVTELRELRLTGVVSYEDAKKPQVEQAYVPLVFSERLEPLPHLEERTLHIVYSYLAKHRRASLKELSFEFRKAGLLVNPAELRRLLESAQRPSEGGSEPWTSRTIDWFRFLGVNPETLGRPRDAKRALIEKLFPTVPITKITTLRESLTVNDRLALLGSPGSGKTTVLQNIALTYARERAGDRRLRKRGIMKSRLGGGKWLTPIFIRLASAAPLLTQQADGSAAVSTMADVAVRVLPADLRQEFEAVAKKYFDRQLRRGRCVVLLDGVDEVPAATEYQAVKHAVEALLRRFGENRYVVTSREAGWRGGIGEGFRILTLRDLTDRQIEDFIDSWYGAVEKNAVVGSLEDESKAEVAARIRRSSGKAQSLKSALRASPGIKRLASNPMLLSSIALVHRNLAVLPRERGKLYSECSKLLLELWDVARGVRLDDTGLKLQQKEALLARIAIELHRGGIGARGGGREAQTADIEALVGRMLPSLGRSEDESSHLLQRLIERSGILVERERGTLAFGHHTFQEYFAARYLASISEPAFLEPMIEDGSILSDWWKEVMLLYTGLLADASPFLRRLAKMKEPTLFLEGLRLTGLCLGEAVEVRATELREEIAGRLLGVRIGLGRMPRRTSVRPEIVNYLITWCREDSWFGAAAAVTLRHVQAEDSGRFNALILAALEDERPDAARAAMEALAAGTERDTSADVVAGLGRFLGNQDDSLRRACIEALVATAKQRNAGQALMEVISAVLGRGDEREVASALEIAGRVARRLHWEEWAERILLEALASSRERVGVSAARTAAYFVDVLSETALEKVLEVWGRLREPSPYRIGETIEKVSPEEGARFWKVAAKVLSRSKDVDVRLGATVLLRAAQPNQVRSLGIVDVLESLLADEDPEMAEATRDALELLGIAEETGVRRRAALWLNDGRGRHRVAATRIFRHVYSMELDETSFPSLVAAASGGEEKEALVALNVLIGNRSPKFREPLVRELGAIVARGGRVRRLFALAGLWAMDGSWRGEERRWFSAFVWRWCVGHTVSA